MSQLVPQLSTLSGRRSPTKSARAVEPLTLDETKRLTGIATRLLAELRSLVDGFPVTQRQASRLSAKLSVDRTICRRVLVSVRAGSESGLAGLVSLPGIEGLTLFVKAVGEKSSPQNGLVQSALASIDLYAGAIEEMAGSQARLCARIGAEDDAGVIVTQNEPAKPDTLAMRKSMHTVAAMYASQRVDTLVMMAGIRPLPEDPSKVEIAGLFAYVGWHAEEGALPLVGTTLHLYSEREPEPCPAEFRNIDQKEAWDQGLLITELCTKPLPKVSVTTRRGHSLNVLDVQPSIEPPTVVIGTRAVIKNPCIEDERLFLVGQRIKYPTRRVIVDLYAERSLVMSSVPGSGGFLIASGPPKAPVHRWHERLPDDVPQQVLELNATARRPTAWGRHDEATRLLFDKMGWSKGEFMGYRSEVEYPLWGAQYCQWLDFYPHAE